MRTLWADQLMQLTYLTDAETIAVRLREMLSRGFRLNEPFHMDIRSENDEDKIAPVLRCILSGNRGSNLVLAEMLRKGANPNVQDAYGGTTPMMFSIKGDTDLLQTLLEAGADTEMQDNEGQTVLHWAAGSLNPNAVALLLRYGANHLHRDHANQSAADKARASGIDWIGEPTGTEDWSPLDQALSDAALAARMDAVIALLEDT